MKIKYCPKCGNTGVLIDGTPCDCRVTLDDLYDGVECLEIPEAYRGIKFSQLLLPTSLGPAYQAFMGNTYDLITSLRWKCKNAIICSPPQSGKSILAYSIIQELFRKEIDVFPIFDILEIKRIMSDLEYGRQQSMGVDNPMRLYTVPYLFAVMPQMTNFDTYDTAAMLIARRTRRGNSTILLYGGAWNQLVYNDSKKSLKGLAGNGSLTTIEVNSWSAKEETE
jgi:hypothetical protein